MKVFKDKQFEDFDDRDSSAVFEGIEFNRCHFDGCLVSMTKDPRRRSTIRNIRLINCSDNGSAIGRALVENCVVENLKTPGLFQTFGAAFKHVVLRGKLDRIMISNDDLPDSSVNPGYEYENVEAFRAANADYYRNVDWALDISEGEFKDLDIRGIPSRLIRRDPETQVVVSRQRLLDGDDWREFVFDAAPCHVAFHLLLDSPYEETLIIAPKRHRKFPLYMADIELLREAGIAEPE